MDLLSTGLVQGTNKASSTKPVSLAFTNDNIQFEDWGLIDYEQALKKQIEYVQHVASDESHPGYLIFCSHHAVVTTGRQTKPEDIFAWNGPVIEVSRGGRATYHGPSQIVVYPILNLKKSRAGRGPQEIRGYIRALEQAIVSTLKNYGIEAQGKTSVLLDSTKSVDSTILAEKIDSQALPETSKQSASSSSLEDTGVWIQDKKIASLGIAVRKWISFHGAAINVIHDDNAFKGLWPCGYKSDTMTSLERILNRPVDVADFKVLLKQNCLLYL